MNKTTDWIEIIAFFVISACIITTRACSYDWNWRCLITECRIYIEPEKK